MGEGLLYDTGRVLFRATESDKLCMALTRFCFVALITSIEVQSYNLLTTTASCFVAVKYSMSLLFFGSYLQTFYII